MKNFIIFFFVLLILNSCTVEKRRYMSGYNVERHSSNRIESKNVDNNQGVSNDEISIENKTSKSDVQLVRVDGQDSILDTLNNESTTDIGVKRNSENKKQVKRTTRDIDKREERIRKKDIVYPSSKFEYEKNSDYQKTDPLAILAFIMVIVGYLIPNLAIGFILVLAAFIIAIVSLQRIKKDPDSFKGKGLNIATVVLGAIVLLLFLVGLIAITAM